MSMTPYIPCLWSFQSLKGRGRGWG